MGFPLDFFPILFAVPRVAGWLAHWKQSLEAEGAKIWRPRQLYIGEARRDYVPLNARPDRHISDSKYGVLEVPVSDYFLNGSLLPSSARTVKDADEAIALYQQAQAQRKVVGSWELELRFFCFCFRLGVGSIGSCTILIPEVFFSVRDAFDVVVVGACVGQGVVPIEQGKLFNPYMTKQTFALVF